MAVVPLNAAPAVGRSPKAQQRSEGAEEDAAAVKLEESQGQTGTTCRRSREIQEWRTCVSAQVNVLSLGTTIRAS